ncbi:MAG: magnesium-protoporphyrin IX monomethyl ester (oxidative) cyclase [Cyanophyceae cyanobacterium]
MVNSLEKQAASPKVDSKRPSKETILTPRFYTTDFEAMAEMDISVNVEELEAIIEEFRVDYNRHHFVRDAEFEKSWDSIQGETRELFIEFLERSCTAEFSGFLLYKELSRKLKERSPILAEGFKLMSRDEARHAGFLNKAMSDFNLALDLGFLTKSKKYTFFAPKFIFYATYLSERIGYWRYIKIYRHLEKHPEDRIYPLFRFFENWCQDENRHGDFFDALLQANPQFLKGLKARLWCRFFLPSVFATMYLNDLMRSGFYKSIGLDARTYDKGVIEKTNETAGRVFPEILDVDHHDFYGLSEKFAANNVTLGEIAESNGPKALQLMRKLPLYLNTGVNLIRMYFIKPIRTDLSKQVSPVR